MYIHLGADAVVRTDEIIGLFDLDTTTVSKNTRRFLADMEKMGNVIPITDELPRSFAVCRTGGKTTVYLSQLSTATLKKRLNFFER